MVLHSGGGGGGYVLDYFLDRSSDLLESFMFEIWPIFNHIVGLAHD